MDRQRLLLLCTTTLLGIGIVFAISNTQASHYIAVQTPCDYVVYTDGFDNYFAQDCFDNTIVSSGSDAEAVIESTVSLMTDGETLLLDSGTFTVDSTININKPINILGISDSSTIIKPASDFGNYVLDINPNTGGTSYNFIGKNLDIKDFAIDLRGFTSTSGIKVKSTYYSEINDLYVEGGHNGIEVENFGLSDIIDVEIVDFDNFGVLILGEGNDGTETMIKDSIIRLRSGGSAVAAVNYTRTTSLDNGGVYIVNTKIGSPASTMTYGVWFKGPDPTFNAYLHIYNSVIDDVDDTAIYLQNSGHTFIDGRNWITATNTAISLGDFSKVIISDNIIKSAGDAIVFRDATQMPTYVMITNNMLEHGPGASDWTIEFNDLVDYPRGLVFEGNKDNSPDTTHVNYGIAINNMQVFADAQSDKTVVETATSFATRPNAGIGQTVTLLDGNTNKLVGIANDNGDLIVKDNNNNVIFKVTEEGSMYITQKGINVPLTGATTTITLPKAEPDANYGVIITQTSSDAGSCYTRNKTTTSFQITCSQYSAGDKIDYIIIR